MQPTVYSSSDRRCACCRVITSETSWTSCGRACVVTVADMLDGHVVLDIECLDRLYLNGYVPKLQVGGQVVTFLHDHRGMPIASPAVFEQIGTRFRRAVARFAGPTTSRCSSSRRASGRPTSMDPLPAAGRPARAGPAWWRSAGRRSSSWCGPPASATPTRPGAPQFSFAKAERRVTCYYFYVWDELLAGRRSSRSARTSRIRSRSGSTGMSGPSGRRPGPGSASPSCPTGSPAAMTRMACS